MDFKLSPAVTTPISWLVSSYRRATAIGKSDTNAVLPRLHRKIGGDFIRGTARALRSFLYKIDGGDPVSTNIQT